MIFDLLAPPQGPRGRGQQGKFDEFISPDEELLRETCKTQNIHPILSSP